MSAPRGTVSLVRNFQNSGTYTHNSGTFESVSGDNTLINTSGTAPITFHNFTYSGGAFTQIYRDTTVENALTISTGHFKLNNSSNAVTLTIGTTSAAGSIVNNGTLSVDNSGTNKPTVQGASSLYPAVCTGTDWDWNANSAADWKLANLDYQIALTTGTGSASEKITLTGDCEFDAVTVSGGYTLDINGQRVEFGGNVTYELGATFDADGLMLFHGGFTKYGTLNNAASGDIMTMSTSGTPTFSYITGYRTFFQNGGVQLGTGGFTDVTNAIVAGTTNVGTRDTSSTNLTIATGGTFQAEAKTHTVSEDFTTSGGLAW